MTIQRILKSNKFDSFIRFPQKHWFVSTLFLTSAGWYFSLIIAFWGERLRLLTADHRFTAGGISVTVFILLTVVYLTISSRYIEHKDKARLQEIPLLENTLDSLDKVLDFKCNNQLKSISDIKEKSGIPPVIYTDPDSQIAKILGEISSCLRAFLAEPPDIKFNINMINTRLCYTFPAETNFPWKWGGSVTELGITIDEMISKDTTFNYLLRKGSSRVFFNSKQEAYEKNCYIPDSSDEYDAKGNLKGSVACFLIDVKHNDKTYIKAVLGISTYVHRFSSLNDKEHLDNLIHNIYDYIIKDFEIAIKSELCNYYIKYLNEKSNP